MALRQAQGMVKVGCCGWARGRAAYFPHFRLVEVQQTFYKLLKLETALRWRQEAPPGFEFSLKAWQAITHPPPAPPTAGRAWRLASSLSL